MELRMFLLYTGPVVLLEAFPDGEDDDRYCHFMALHAAVRLLSRPCSETEI